MSQGDGMGNIEHHEAVRRAADAIWTLDALSTDEARDELVRDTGRAIETYLDATGLRGAVEAFAQIAKLARNEHVGAPTTMHQIAAIADGFTSTSNRGQ